MRPTRGVFRNYPTYGALTTATPDETLRIPDDFARRDTKRNRAAQKAPNVKEGWNEVVATADCVPFLADVVRSKRRHLEERQHRARRPVKDRDTQPDATRHH